MRYLDEEALGTFANELSAFRDRYDLHDLFSSRIDHLAVKMYDKADYELYKQEVLPYCQTMVEADLDNRHIATAKLNTGIDIMDSHGTLLGTAQYLEIMQPRPHKVGKDLVGIDHCEIDIDSFAETRKLMDEKGVPANQGEGEDEYEHTVVVRLNDKGQEVKFSDESLSSILPREIAEGVSKVLK